jgi:hypothetical protein
MDYLPGRRGYALFQTGFKHNFVLSKSSLEEGDSPATPAQKEQNST